MKLEVLKPGTPSRKIALYGGALMLGAGLASCSYPATNATYEAGNDSQSGFPNYEYSSTETTPQPHSLEARRQKIAHELCDLLYDPAPETTPWNAIFELQDKLDGVNKKYRAESSDVIELADSYEYCLDKTEILTAPRG